MYQYIEYLENKWISILLIKLKNIIPSCLYKHYIKFYHIIRSIFTNEQKSAYSNYHKKLKIERLITIAIMHLIKLLYS